MADYYFVSQLPSLDGLGENADLPITEERFSELCNRYLGKRAKFEIGKLTLVPPVNREKSTSGLVETWNRGEQNLRISLAKMRAEKMKKPFELEAANVPVEFTKAAQTAVETESPLEAELFLNSFRLKLLESIRPMDIFSDDYVFYYAIKLKLLTRIRKFDINVGENAYKDIYDSIMKTEKTEDLQ